MMPLPRLPEGLPSAWLLDCEAFAEAIRPDPDLSITEWADERRILAPESSAEHGPWRTDRVPHSREIMDVLSPSDPTREITFVAGAQVAKTEIGNNFIGCIIDHAPGPTMMVYATSGTGKRSSHTRLAKMIEATPTLRDKVGTKSRDKTNSTTRKDFPGGVLVVAGANSAADLASQPIRYLFEDELDKYPEDVDGHGPAVELAETRTRTFPRRKIYRTSTPTVRGPLKIWGFYEKSDMRQRWVPCPHCDEYQVLVWEQFRYETERIWEVADKETGEIRAVPAGTVDAIERDTGQLADVWYECAHCSERIEEHHKQTMLPRGRWIAQRPEARGHAGFHLPSYYSPLGWYSWADIVRKRLDAEKDPTGLLLRQWMNETAGLPYEAGDDKPSDLSLKERCEPYSLGTVPMGGLFLTGGVDVQHNRLEVAVKAWGRGEENWLVDYQVLYGDPESDSTWDALQEYLDKPLRHELGVPMRILATGIDCGFLTQTVYAFTRRRQHRGMLAVRGQSQSGKSILGRPTQQDVDHRGQRIPNGVQLWPVGTDTAKTKIYARLRIDTPGPGYMHFPRGLPDDYFKGLTAERQVPKYVKGYRKLVWEKDATQRNEPLDLEVYAYAAAIYAGVTRVNWDKLEASLKATAGDLFVQADSRLQTAEIASAAAAAPAVDVSPANEPPAAIEQPPAPAPRRANWVTGFKGF